MSFLFIVFLIIYAGFANLVGKAAQSKGRSYWQWFFIAVLISPLIAAVFLMAFAPMNQGGATRKE